MTSSFVNKKFAFVFTTWWLCWSLMQYDVLLDAGLTGMQAFSDSAISSFFLAACCLLVSNNMRYYLPNREKYWYVLVLSLGLSMVWLITTRSLLWWLWKNDAAYAAIMNHTSTVRFGVSFLLIGCFTVISLLWYSQQEQKESDERKTETARLAKDAELLSLRQQLQPHFLFNSLNSISALTTSQPQLARQMIEQLSEFLRGTLRKDGQQWHTLREELDYLELYLSIEKVRFGHRLQTKITFDDGGSSMKLPPMLLQPVVENAIKFGLYDTIGEVEISINAAVIGGLLHITVTNPFDPQTSQPRAGTGFGLESIRRRLFLLFSRHDLLQTESSDAHFITTIIIPQ